MTNKDVSILLVEDDDIDIMVIERALKKLGLNNPLIIAKDGYEALEILRNEKNKHIDMPYVIILDLNMPRMNGFEFLDKLRDDPNLKRAIVFVLTTSNSDEDRYKSYDKNVAGYIVKKNIQGGFGKVVEMLDHYWRTIEFPQ